MKKIISVILVVAIIFSAVSVTAFAKSEQTVVEAFREAILNFEDSVDVSDFGYYVQNNGHIRLYETLFYEVYEAFADMYYVDVYNVSTDDFVYDSQSGLVKEWKLKYIYSKEDVEWVSDLAEEYIFSAVEDDWTDLEKALYFHDYICTFFQYDIRLFFEQTQNEVARDIYKMFSDGMGVCQAYANTYEYLLQHENIECKLVASDDANHEWNLVKIGGQWYHVDVTQDDPLIAIDGQSVALLDMAGNVSHKYFLLSDEGIYDYTDSEDCGDHYNWYCLDGSDITCNSKRFETGYVFADSSVSFVPVENQWYYIVHNQETAKLEFLKTSDFKNNSKVFEIDAYWGSSDPNAYYPMGFSGLSGINGYLIYNTDSAVLAYNVKNGATKTLFTLDQLRTREDITVVGDGGAIPSNAHIYGTKADKDGVYCQISLAPADTVYYVAIVGTCEYAHPEREWVIVKEATAWTDGLKEEQCTLCKAVLDSEIVAATGGEYPKGDADHNGKVEIGDLAVLKKIVAGLAEFVRFDLNGDGNTDIGDLAILKKFIAGITSQI